VLLLQSFTEERVENPVVGTAAAVVHTGENVSQKVRNPEE